MSTICRSGFGRWFWVKHRRHSEVLAVFGEPRRMGHKRKRLSFETPRKRAAPQDDGWMYGWKGLVFMTRTRGHCAVSAMTSIGVTVTSPPATTRVFSV